MSIFMQFWCKMATRSGMRDTNGFDWMSLPTYCNSAQTDRFPHAGRLSLLSVLTSADRDAWQSVRRHTDWTSNDFQTAESFGRFECALLIDLSDR
jgi:hypothetical protein